MNGNDQRLDLSDYPKGRPMNAYNQCKKRKYCLVRFQQYSKVGYKCNWGWKTDSQEKCRFLTSINVDGAWCLLCEIKIYPQKRSRTKSVDVKELWRQEWKKQA